MKRIICTLEEYTNYKIRFRYSWKTRKLRPFFRLKDLIVHKANFIYKGTFKRKILEAFYIRKLKPTLKRILRLHIFPAMELHEYPRVTF